MNKLVQAALEKLVQDDTFRAELSGMLDDVNRAAEDPEMISRENEEEIKPEEEVIKETKDGVERADATVAPPATTVSSEMLSEIVSGILGSPEILTNLLNALVDVQNQMPADQNQQARMQASIETLERGVKELQDTIKEHDGVLTQLAEDTIVDEAELPRTIRARTVKKLTKEPGKEEQVSLEDRAAKVLSRMDG